VVSLSVKICFSSELADASVTRDHMLSDPRFAQYFHDHSDIWDKVKRGQTRLTIMVIKTVSPDLTQVAAEPFTLTTEIIQHLQENIDAL